MNPNISNLESAIEWLKNIIVGCLRIYSGNADEIKVDALNLLTDESCFMQFVDKFKPSREELLIIMISIVPHLHPDFYNRIISTFLPNGGDFPEFGGVRGNSHRGILPTGETALFILAGDNLEKRLEVQRILSGDHWFAKKHILWLESVREGEPTMSGRLIIDSEVIETLTTGVVSKPRFSIEFPAEYIETEMEWGDLVLHPKTLHQIKEIEHWITYNHTLLHDWGMKKRIKPGYRALFYGPPGTGKTLTATLLGKYTGKDVFRIDLSRVVSKYIGETEKNLSPLFDKAADKNWILFFDEADALFGKRTDIRDAHDKYANQEVAYLLQRIESYEGLVILATNQRGNIDDAFTRRFQAVIHFPMPGAGEREEIWLKAFPGQIELAADINWPHIAAQYELTGAGIINVAHYCAVEVLASKEHYLSLKLLETAILREYIKEGKVV
jgi:AAA+ superfamily predicted ATPase